MCVLNFGDTEPIEDIPYPDWPIPSTEYQTYYLGNEGQLTPKKPEADSILSYNSTSFEDDGMVSFKLTFDKHTRFIGLPKAVLFMSCDEHDDMNVYVNIRKLDKNGRAMYHVQCSMDRRWVKKEAEIPAKDIAGTSTHPGPQGILRASRRHADKSLQWHENFPHLTHDRDEKVPKGEIVELEIGIWHLGVDFQAGESLRVDISGQSTNYPELRAMNAAKRKDTDGNQGSHKIHIGDKYPSRVVLPFVPL